ncbi:PAS domain S-box protein [Maribacter arcticus]|uniref:PAS domain S-box-containing protein n=1 Tax=Maribacter arcticus TaxID=561365 RepID=A0A1T5AKR9_9FLAO|nr:PAS domain S-box protein [Maribacter arcticus]SKB35397.1 PAS domain S-box-containing protein [Maribacter arcticus]
MPEPKQHSIFNKPFLIGFLVFLLVLIISQTITYQKFQILQEAQQHEVNERVLKLKEDLQDIFDQSFDATQTLSFIVENYGIPNNFDSITQLLLNSNKHIDALELVDDQGVITHVYPLKGNDILGFNILEDSIGQDGALTTLKRRDYFTAGPISLKQGGTGFVSRRPLFNENGFAGFVATLVKLSTVVTVAQLDSLENTNFSYQLAKINADQSEEIFYNNTKTSTEGAIKVPITTSHGEMKLYVISNRSQSYSTILFFFILGLLLALVCGVFTMFFLRQPIKLNQLVQEKTGLLKESQEKYQTLIEQASDGILVFNNSGDIIDINILGAEMIGYAKHELTQKNIADIIAPDDLAKTPLRFSKITKEKPFLSERKLIRKDGSVFYGEISSKMLPDNTIQGIIRDTTERRELEQTAQNNLQKFSKAFNNSTIGMAIRDQNKRFVDANCYFLDLIGYTLEEIKGKAIQELGIFDFEANLKINPSLADFATIDKIGKLDVVFKTKSGKVLYLLASKESFDFENEKFSLTSFVDQTEAKKASLEIRQSEAKFRELTVIGIILT